MNLIYKIYNCVRRKKTYIRWPRYSSTKWFREDNNAMNGRRERSRGKPRDGRNTSHIGLYLVRWQQQAEWWRTGINFADTSGQRSPDEDVLREEEADSNSSFCISRCLPITCLVAYMASVVHLPVLKPKCSSYMLVYSVPDLGLWRPLGNNVIEKSSTS